MASQNNSYFEQIQQKLGSLSQDALVDKISKCQEVVDKLSSDSVWKTVLADAQEWVKRLDSKWQETYDEKSLAHLRVLKLAYAHIVSLPDKYKTDLKAAQDLLDGMRNTDSSIQRDYDAETKTQDSQ